MSRGKSRLQVTVCEDSLPQMTKIRQSANGGLPKLGQKILNTHGESPALSEKKLAPAAFNLNQSSAVCLPLVTESQKLIWVVSNQINLQLEGTAELDKAFDRFPYLTHKQTAELAQRCSLHPDQVKMWFMVQRLRYGISWDYEDICKLQWKFKARQGTEEPQNQMRKKVKEDRREKKTWKREGEESAGTKAGEDREVEEDKKNTQKKRKGMTVTDKMGEKRRKRQEESIVEGAGGVEIRSDIVKRDLQASTQTETTLFIRKKKKAKANKRLLSAYEQPAQKSFVVHDEQLDASSPLILHAFDAPPLTDIQTPLLEEVHVFPSSTPNVSVTPANGGFGAKPVEGELSAEATNYDGAITDVDGLRELIINHNRAVADDSLRGPTHTSKTQQGSQEVDILPTSIRFRTKTRAQLAMLKMAFSYCQYPDSNEYDSLEMLTGVSRCVLVQWFGDMRYYVKKVKPGWLTQEQYSQALANVRYQQFLKMLEPKGHVKRKLEMGKSCSDGESVQVHSE